MPSSQAIDSFWLRSMRRGTHPPDVRGTARFWQPSPKPARPPNTATCLVNSKDYSEVPESSPAFDKRMACLFGELA